MRRFIGAALVIAVVAVFASNIIAEEKERNSCEVKGSVVVLKETSVKPVGPINWGGLIVVDIQDSGSRPPQDIKVNGGGCIPLGHVRGVATNSEGRSLMGGGYTWYLFKAPQNERSVEINVSYIPNGRSNPKPVKRRHLVQLAESA